MALNIDNLEQIIYEPSAITHKILQNIGDTGINITDVNSPFMVLLEATNTLTVHAIEENLRNHRRLFPSLANNKTDLWGHVHDYDYINLFAIPSEAKIIFLLNVLDIQQYGIDNDTYKEITIPATSTVTVDKHIFTLLNDITIRLYTDKRVSIEQKLNSITSDGNVIGINPISIMDIGILEGRIVKDVSDIEYITFETRVKQTHREVIEGTIIRGIGFHKNITLLDNEKYWWSEVYIRNNDTWKLLSVTHSDIVYDKDKPTVWIRYLNDTVTYKIPKLYTDTLYGNIRIVLYTTKGKVNLPLDKYNIDEFIIDLEDTGKNITTAVSPHINIYASSVTPCQGGVDNRDVDDIRDLVINDAIGNFQLPITEKQLEEDIYELGYDLTLSTDTVTDRVFKANKFTILDPTIDKGIKAKLNPITLHYVLDAYINNNFIKYIDVYNSLIIKSNSIFKHIDGNTTIVSNEEYDIITTLTNNDRLPIILNEYRYFFNPFHIVIDYDRSVINTRMYMLDTPTIVNNRITSKNDYLKERVNSVSYSINKTHTGYIIAFKVIGNIEFNKLDKSSIYGQLKFMVNNIPVYYKGIYDVNNDIIKFDMDTDFVINDIHKIHMLHHDSELSEVWFNLNEKVELIIYSDSPFLNNNIYEFNNRVITDEDAVALDVEDIHISFGYNLPYLWNRVLSNYKEREPLRYQEDIPAFYKENVYKKDESGSIINIVDGKVAYNIIHKKGDLVLDDRGNVLNTHRRGDIVYGEDGLPVITDDSRITRTIDIPVIEYEFKVANSVDYIDYYKRSMLLIDSWVKKDMTHLNKRVLDNSIIYFKPSKSIENIPILINDTRHYTGHTCIPTVKLYVTDDLGISNVELEDKVGMIIDTYLERKTVKVGEIRELLIKEIGYLLVGVKVLNITDIDDIEAFTIDSDNRINIKKKIESGVDGKLIVRYKVNVSVINV